MAAFDPDAPDDLAYRLMFDSPVTLFWRRAILDENVAWLFGHGYQVLRFDASAWLTKDDMLRGIALALDFPPSVRHNLDGFNDRMRDVVDQEYGWPPEATGLALVFTRYDTIAGREPDAAHAVLDILTDQSRSALLFGRRLMCLVQSDDPDIHFGRLGAVAARWNDAESPRARRG
jgi:Barstar (barnase inhibitor)